MIKKLYKQLFFLLFFSSLLFFVKDIQALQFEKVTDNPLSISYINNYSSHLQTHIFKENNLYKGIFTIARYTLPHNSDHWSRYVLTS